MPIWRSLAEVPDDLGRAVVTIGNFDGVHRGHRHVVQRAREVATEVGVDRVVAVTFDPHPIAVLRPEHAPSALTGIAQRGELLAEAGVDDVLVLPFDRDMAGWSARGFVERIVVDALGAAAVVVGASFRFGARAAGDVETLRRCGAEQDFVVEPVPLEGGPQVWSSTYVRTCLGAGDVEGAAEALGRPYVLWGRVVEGDRRGRELGYPTANVPIPAGMAAPADGVYAGWLTALDRASQQLHRLPTAISVGTNPTFEGDRERRVEAYVLDRTDLELYGLGVEVGFVARLRGMAAFESVEALLVQMADDVEGTRRVLADRTW